jgi:hypothetical protein
MSSQKRKTLSARYDTVWALEGRRITFTELYPELECVCVDIHVTGKGTYGWAGDVAFDNGTYRHVYDCPNPECNMGGVFIDRFLSSMFHARETTKTETQKSQGYEGAGLCRCENTFKLKVVIRYKLIREEIVDAMKSET